MHRGRHRRQRRSVHAGPQLPHAVDAPDHTGSFTAVFASPGEHGRAGRGTRSAGSSASSASTHQCWCRGWRSYVETPADRRGAGPARAAPATRRRTSSLQHAEGLEAHAVSRRGRRRRRSPVPRPPGGAAGRRGRSSPSASTALGAPAQWPGPEPGAATTVTMPSTRRARQQLEVARNGGHRTTTRACRSRVGGHPPVVSPRSRVVRRGRHTAGHDAAREPAERAAVTLTQKPIGNIIFAHGAPSWARSATVTPSRTSCRHACTRHQTSGRRWAFACRPVAPGGDRAPRLGARRWRGVPPPR